MKADNQKRFPEVEIPQLSPEYIYTAGYYRRADNIVPDSEKARNNFYVTESRNDDTVYVYPWVYSRDLSVQEIHFFWKDAATMADFFPQWVRDFIAYSYAMNSNPLPAIRNRFPEFDFVFREEVIDRPDAPLPKEGATILVDRQGNMAVYNDEPQPTYEVEADDPVGMPELAIPG